MMCVDTNGAVLELHKYRNDANGIFVPDIHMGFPFRKNRDMSSMDSAVRRYIPFLCYPM